MYVLNHEVYVNHDAPISFGTPFGDGIRGHRYHEFLAVRPLNFKHVARAEIFDGDAFAEVSAFGGDAGKPQQVAKIIFVFTKHRQSLTRHREYGTTQIFCRVAIVDFGEARDCAIFGGAKRSYRQRAVVEAFMPFQTIHGVREQLETDFTRHAVRAGNGGKRDGGSWSIRHIDALTAVRPELAEPQATEGERQFAQAVLRQALSTNGFVVSPRPFLVCRLQSLLHRQPVLQQVLLWLLRQQALPR